MDEVDGMAGNEDRGGILELINTIKSSKIPIICICNDRQVTWKFNQNRLAFFLITLKKTTVNYNIRTSFKAIFIMI